MTQTFLCVVAALAILGASGSSLPAASAEFAASPGTSPAPDPARRPNIVLIVADDLGYGELTVQGFAKDIPTPNIDAIAKRGVRFTQGYVSAPLCSPSRAGLLTGRYQQRFGHEFNPGPQENASSAFGLPRTETMLAERMKAFGYATGMVGKWHLGFTTGLTPLQRGFDVFFGFLGGAHSYLPGQKAASIFRGSTPIVEPEYLTDAFAREAVAFIEQHQAGPFFLYLPFNAVHNPLQAPEKYLSRFPGIKDEKRRTYAAMTAAMDDAVGRVMGTLDRLKLAGDTLVVFISDNGGPTPTTSSGNGPLRGQKSQMWEGGIRVPFMMQWPGRLPAGKVYDQPVISLDIHPTIVSAATDAAISPDWKLDGVNLLPFLTGATAGRPHETLYWRMGEKHAIRDGDWKLTVEQGGARGFFNLAQDIGEKTDLSAKHPEKLKELQAKFDAWSAQMASPNAPRAAGSRGAGAGKKNAPLNDRLVARFAELDANHDGKLTGPELGRPRVFAQMDANRDGAVTLDEAKAYWAARR